MLFGNQWSACRGPCTTAASEPIERVIPRSPWILADQWRRRRGRASIRRVPRTARFARGTRTSVERPRTSIAGRRRRRHLSITICRQRPLRHIVCARERDCLSTVQIVGSIARTIADKRPQGRSLSRRCIGSALHRVRPPARMGVRSPQQRGTAR